jgi:hypothetical protein
MSDSNVALHAPDNPYAALHATLDKMMDDTVRIPGTKAWILLCGYAIGETAEVCALADAFVKHHGHGIILIAAEKHTALVRMYAHRFLKVVLASDDLMRALLRSNYVDPNRFEPDHPISACWIDRGFAQSDGIKYMWRYPERGGIGEMDMARFVLRLPWNARIDPPVISAEAEERAWQLGREGGLRMGRSVLLCPINNSAKKFPDVFWTAVAQRLNELGYQVFTNMGGWKPHNGLAVMPIAGTIPVDLPIDTVIPFIQLCGRVITGTNGMSFLMMLSGMKNFKMTQVLPMPRESHEDHSSLGFRAPRHQTGSDMIASFLYMAPELCLDMPLNEFMVAYDEEPEELTRLARVVADQDTRDASSVTRLAGDGRPFIEAHLNWLRDLA